MHIYKKKKQNISNRIISILLILSLLIIFYSIFQKKAPDRALSVLWSKISGKNIKHEPPVDSLLQEISIKDSFIDSLKKELKVFDKNSIYKKALVNVESGMLNMRKEPLLASRILVRIPDSSLVNILYFDTKYYYINGEKGRWCKVRYAGKEGWVWDGFIEMQ